MHCRASRLARICVTSACGEQRVDAAQLLQLALVQDRDAVANVLHVGQQVAAHDDRLALRP